MKLTLLFSAAIAIVASSLLAPPVSANSSDPSPVSNINVSLSGTTANVSWSAPSFPGTDWRGDLSQIDRYTVYAWSSSTSPYGSLGTCSTSNTSCTIYGLTAGATYYIEVNAYNDWVGSSRARSSDFSVCCTVPGAPARVSATHGNGAATVSWAPPSSTGGGSVTYTVSISGGSTVCTTDGTSCVVTGLVNGQSYTFNVYASNSAGSSSRTTSNAVTPKGPPGPPLGVSASPSIKTAEVFWSPPANDGGSAIAQYVVVASPGGQSCAALAQARSCVVTNLLDNTDYTFVVHADNSEGRGASSAPSAPVRTATIPGPPLNVQAEVARGRGIVEWIPPSDIGGAEVQQYVVVAQPGNAVCTTEKLTCTVTGLSNGTTYSFEVTAINGVGPGQVSAPSTPVELLAVPTAPRKARAVMRGDKVRISWKKPKSTGGKPIRRYTVSSSIGDRSCKTSAKRTRCVITGLPMARTVNFVITAHTAKGKGASSTTNSVRTPNPPVVTQPKPDKPEQAIR